MTGARGRLGAVLCALTLPMGCGPEATAPVAPVPPCADLRWAGPSERRSLVLVVSDTMRRDRMGVYGGLARTPAFDRFARENLVFTRAHTQAPWTKPSVATLFTGLYPSQHGVLSHPHEAFRQGGSSEILESDVLGDEFVTLAEVLRSAGYRTAAFVSNPWMQESLGFAQGFDVYDDSFSANDTPGEVVTATALDWLRILAPGAPYFLYLHYMDAHAPFPPLRREDVLARRDEIASDRRPLHPSNRSFIRDVARYQDGSAVVGPGIPPTRALMELVYDGGVEAFDAAFASLLGGLESGPAWNDTGLIVTSDHGEALFARGWTSHGHALFVDELAVPLAARLPGVSSRGPVSCPVGLIDLMATLCVYLGLECGDREEFGVSLVAAPGENDARRGRYAISEGVIHRPRSRSLADSRYKLIWEPDGRLFGAANASPWSLYDTRVDPEETRNLLDEAHRSASSERVFEVLSAELAEGVPRMERTEKRRIRLDEETQERLRSLGYLE